MIINVDKKYETQFEYLRGEKFSGLDLKLLEDLVHLIEPDEFKVTKMEDIYSVKIKKSNGDKLFSLILAFTAITKKCGIIKICNSISSLPNNIMQDFFYDIKCIFQLNKELQETLFSVITLYNDCMQNYFRIGKERKVDGKFEGEEIIAEYTFKVSDGKLEDIITLFNINY